MRAVLWAAVLSGCMYGVGDPPPDPGPGSGSGSGSNSNNQQAPDGGASGVACTNAAYDPCTSPSQCTSGVCQLFSGSGFQVCTQSCTPGDATTCPQQNGMPVQCNNMGICKPAAANTCTR